MKLSNDIINEIRNSANIVDVIGHYIPLIKKGKGYTAVCPFHDDHDPSLSISEDKQIYKCFVCGKGGNCFTFIQDFTKCSFAESVVEVSKIIGKPIELDDTPKKIDKNQKYYDVLNSMVAYSNYLLVGSKLGVEAMKYLNNRGLEKEVVEYFNIGFNPERESGSGKAPIYEYLHSQNFKDEDILKVGVCRFIQNGMVDVFHNRITFPIHNADGNPIAFSARDYTNSSDAKYINSGETILYTKGEHLYNYHRAKNECRKLGYVIVCEGVMDVIAYHRAEKDNVVATLGTACTMAQINLLKSLSNHVSLSYDGDKAGQSANLKIGKMLLEQGFEVNVIDNRSELDPDEIIAKGGKNALKDLENKKISYIDFAMNYYSNLYNLNNYEDRKRMTILVSELIDHLKDDYDKENYSNALYELTKIRKRQIQENKKQYNNKQVAYSYSIDGLTKAEYIILTQMSLSIRGLDFYQKELGYLLGTSSQDLSMLIIDDYRKNKKCSLSRIYDETDDEAIRNLISSLALVEDLPKEYDEQSLLAAIEKVKREIKMKRKEFLQEEISKIEGIDPEKSKEYLQEYLQLVKELKG